MTTNIFLAGVGGQGILSFARVLGELAMIRKANVLIGETHGMAQRGGSVTATVRYGNVYSPIIPRGRADVLIGFEPLEAARYAWMLSPSGMAVVNTEPIVPYSVSATRSKYPPVQALIKTIEDRGAVVITLNATEIAEKVKFPLAANSVMLGAVAATGKIDAGPDEFRQAIRKTVPRKMKENLAAFDLGHEHAEKMIAALRSDSSP
ncbi:MAG: indolepyruvate oxidoreductase subunit beta [Thermoplasmata archaeon]